MEPNASTIPSRRRKLTEDTNSSFESRTVEYKTKGEELRDPVSQLEQSHDSQRNLSEIEIRSKFNGDEVESNSSEQKSIYSDDPYDTCSEKVTEETLLFSELLETDAPPDIEASQIKSSKNDAYSDSEESTDSDHDFEMMKLFAWLDKKNWARSYYDCEDGVVIHVEPGKVETSTQLVVEEFPNFQKYRMVETDPGVCRYCADPVEEDKEKSKETNQNQTLSAQNTAETIDIQTAEAHDLEEQLDSQAAEARCLDEKIDSQTTGGYGQGHVEFTQSKSPKAPVSQSVLLQPGYTITSDEHPARFSGRVGSKGLTVAHIGPSNTIHHYCNDKQHLIGTMEKVLEVDVAYTYHGQTTNIRTTADLGLLDLKSYCLVQNIICDKNNRLYGLQLYKGSIKGGTPLRIIDREGRERHGKLTSGHFTLKRNKQDSSLVLEDDSNREVYNMLRIQNENSAISDRGDSGILVTSIPKEGSNELFVYGIVTHLHKEDKCEQGSSTIANRLPDVLNAIDASGRNVGLRDPRSNDIEFTNNEV